MATVRNSTPSLRVRSVTVLGSPHSALMGTYTENKNTPYNQQFSSVFTTEELSKTPDLGINTIPSASDIRVTEKGVLKFLSNVNLNKATGPDEISTKFLKEMAHAVTPALTKIFQASIDKSQTSEDWKTVNVLPAFKKGDEQACKLSSCDLCVL